MIIDVHSHAWEYPRHFGDDFRRQARRAAGRRRGRSDRPLRGLPGRRARPIPHRRLRRQGPAQRRVGRRPVRRRLRRRAPGHADRLPVASIRRSRAGSGSCDEGHEELGLRGIKLLPMYAGFRPDDARLDPLWTYATRAPAAGPAAHRHDVRRAGPAGLHAAAAPRRGRHPVPRREDHHGPPRPPVRGRMRRRRSASTRTSTPTSAPCTTGRSSSTTA